MKKHILVCDDDDSIQEIIQIILENNDFKVTTVSSGEQAYQKAQGVSPDLLLLDFWMPGINGEETIKLFKTNSSTKNIPIVLVTALSQITKTYSEIGADGLIEKPFEMDHLLEIVKKYSS